MLFRSQPTEKVKQCECAPFFSRLLRTSRSNLLRMHERAGEIGVITPNKSKSSACPGVLNTYNFFGKAVNEMLNQQNTRKLISPELGEY